MTEGSDAEGVPFAHGVTPVQDVESLIARAGEAYEVPERGYRTVVPSMNLPVKTIGFHIGEMMPNTNSRPHRHMCEALIYILEGRGYSMIDGKRLDWSVGDTFAIPVMCWHSHYAESEPVRLMGIWNIPLLERLGIYFNEEAGSVDGSGPTSIQTTLRTESAGQG